MTAELKIKTDMERAVFHIALFAYLRNYALMKFDIAQMEETADEVSGYMKLLSAPGRLMLLCQLVDGEMSSGELCDAVGMKAPAMSQQLAILRREGIVRTRREGQSIYYAITDPNIMKIMMFLYETFCAPKNKGNRRN